MFNFGQKLVAIPTPKQVLNVFILKEMLKIRKAQKSENPLWDW